MRLIKVFVLVSLLVVTTACGYLDPLLVQEGSRQAAHSSPPRASAEPHVIQPQQQNRPVSAGKQAALQRLLLTAQQQQLQGQLMPANASLERALRIAPDQPEVFYALANLRLQMGRPAQALQLTLRALQLSPLIGAMEQDLQGLLRQCEHELAHQ